jgi:predicted  nucleic acid-binding Zn-ribbon protein
MTGKTGTIVALAVAALMLLPACAGRKGPPDPAKVQEKMTATLDGEKELIRSTVASAERADNLVALLDERDRLVAEHAETVSAHRERMTALMADYGAERDSFEEAISGYNKERSEAQRQIVELIDAMKKEATTEEWKALAKYQMKKLNPRELAYKQAGGGH